MKTKIMEIYKCEYCNKLYQIKSFAEKHEKRCNKNPVNDRPCLSCIHLRKKEITWYEFVGDRDIEIKRKLLYCDRINSFLYPPIVEYKKNQIDLGDEPNKPMPKDCDVYNEETKQMENFFENI